MSTRAPRGVPGQRSTLVHDAVLVCVGLAAKLVDNGAGTRGGAEVFVSCHAVHIAIKRTAACIDRNARRRVRALVKVVEYSVTVCIVGRYSSRLISQFFHVNRDLDTRSGVRTWIPYIEDAIAIGVFV